MWVNGSFATGLYATAPFCRANIDWPRGKRRPRPSGNDRVLAEYQMRNGQALPGSAPPDAGVKGSALNFTAMTLRWSQAMCIDPSSLLLPVLRIRQLRQVQPPARDHAPASPGRTRPFEQRIRYRLAGRMPQAPIVTALVVVQGHQQAALVPNLSTCNG